MPAITEGTYQPQLATAGMPGSSESHTYHWTFLESILSLCCFTNLSTIRKISKNPLSLICNRSTFICICFRFLLSFSFCLVSLVSLAGYLLVSLCGGSVVLSLCFSLEKNSSEVLGVDKDGWSERTGMGGGVMGYLDNNGSKWGPQSGSMFVTLYFIPSHCISAQGFMFFWVCVKVGMNSAVS